MSYGKKIFRIALLILLLMVGTLFVFVILYTREDTSKEVSYEITSQWGDRVFVKGPSIEAGVGRCIRPGKLVCDVAVDTRRLHRGIYEVEVFTADVDMRGDFRFDPCKADGKAVSIEIDLPIYNLIEVDSLDLSGKKYEWSRKDDRLVAEIPADELPSDPVVSTHFTIRGSEGIFICRQGGQSDISISGNAADPSFRGQRLATERTVTDRGFQARWLGLSQASDYSYGDDIEADSVGVEFLVGVNSYQKVERILKYSFLFIVLTYVIVLFCEIIMHRPIPLTNYFLIGVAIVLFYTLLLSFSEMVSFGWAYLVAASMTVALIAGYMWMMLRSRKVGIVIGLLLAAMYTFFFILLGMSTYALLLGSLMIFVALGAMMYASLKINPLNNDQ